MRSFNANFVTEKNKRADGPSPINLVKFDFATPVYLSDQDKTPSGGSAHTGLIKSWGFVDSAISQTPGRGLLGSLEIVDLQLEIIQTASSPFSSNFTTADPLEGVDVTLYQWFGGLLDSEKETIFIGQVHKQPEYDLHRCKVTVRGIWKKYDKLIGEDLIISADDYSGADPDDIGKMLPMVIGSAERVVFRAVDAGGFTTMTADHSDSVTTLNLTDNTYIDSSGTVQVGVEEITYTGKTATTLTGCTRAANGSTAVAHYKGATVAQLQTEYIYLMGHAVKTINAVYVDDVLQSGNYTAYTGQAGDAHASYAGKACIAFTTRPVIEKQVNVGINDTIAVNDGIGVSDTITVGDNLSFAMGGLSEMTRFPNDHTQSYVTNPTNAYDGSGDTYAQVYHASFTSVLSVLFGSTGYGTISGQYFIVKLVTSAAGAIDVADSDGGSVTPSTIVAGVTTPSEFRFFSASTDWDMGIRFTAAGGENVNVYEVHKIVYYTAELDKTGSAYKGGSSTKTGSASKSGTVALTGNSVADTVIGGQVTVDVDGYQDDGSGTITTSANSLIERCDHVFKHIWINILSAPSGSVDSVTFGAAATFYAANSYAFSLVIARPIQASDLLVSLALQCRSRALVTPAGTFKLIIRQTGQASGHAIAKAEMRKGSVKARHTDSDDLLNYFRIYYDRDNRKDAGDSESYTGNKAFTDATSISRYGQKEPMRKELLYFDAVKSSAMVASVGAYILAYHKLIRKMPHLSVFLDNCEIEPGDYIDITHDLDSMSGFVVEVSKILWKMGSARRKVIDHLELVTIEN